jgi:hypothetical protein
VIGPLDVVKDGLTGSLNVDLKAACLDALKNKNAAVCVEHAKSFSWGAMTTELLAVHDQIPSASDPAESGFCSRLGRVGMGSSRRAAWHYVCIAWCLAKTVLIFSVLWFATAICLGRIAV